MKRQAYYSPVITLFWIFIPKHSGTLYRILPYFSCRLRIRFAITYYDSNITGVYSKYIKNKGAGISKFAYP